MASATQSAENSSAMPGSRLEIGDPMSKRIVSVHWYRHGLRLHDNPALLKAIKDADEFYPIFILDGEVAGTKTAAHTRMSFLLEALWDLDESFKKHGTRLHVFRGSPVKIFRRLIQEWGVNRITFEQDPEPIWQNRDNAVMDLCRDMDVECIEEISHTLWNPREIIDNNGGSPPLTFMIFNQVTSIIGPPPRPVEDPDFSHIKFSTCPEHDKKYGIPSLEDLDVVKDEDVEPFNKWIGGETRALHLLTSRIALEQSAFEAGYTMPTQYRPDLVGPPLSLSPHLRFGCLSVRCLYWSIRDVFMKVRPGESLPLSLTAQLLWREYFYTMSINNIHYNTMTENPICLNINWYDNSEHLQKWTQGQTGFPWIDACMNQLRSEGWIHHVARHAVACFLTRGDLWLSWEDGLRVFDKYLLDADWSVCAGNWMWVSSSAFEKILQCPKCFCPVRYGRRMDPSGEYVKRYVPMLKKFPLMYLFEPWKAPLAVQQKAGCIIGQDYPQPMVDHKQVSVRNARLMDRVKQHLTRDVPHCGPSDELEVRQFVWLPDHLPSGGSCTGDMLCEGIEGL